MSTVASSTADHTDEQLRLLDVLAEDTRPRCRLCGAVVPAGSFATFRGEPVHEDPCLMAWRASIRMIAEDSASKARASAARRLLRSIA